MTARVASPALFLFYTALKQFDISYILVTNTLYRNQKIRHRWDEKAIGLADARRSAKNYDGGRADRRDRVSADAEEEIVISPWSLAISKMTKAKDSWLVLMIHN